MTAMGGDPQGDNDPGRDESCTIGVIGAGLVTSRGPHGVHGPTLACGWR
jgi:hypothetical protein